MICKYFTSFLTWSTLSITALASFLSACTPEQKTKGIIQSVTIPELPSANQYGNAIPVEADDLIEDFDAYVGQQVGVRETVGNPIGESTFLLTDYHLLGGKSLLIVNASGHTFTLPHESITDEVLIIGEAQEIDIQQFEEEYGLELDVSDYIGDVSVPAIIAQAIFLSPDPDEVTNRPNAFLNQVIAVEGEIEDRFTPGTFTLDEEQIFGGDDLLVVSTSFMASQADEEDEEEILAVGVVRLLDFSAFEREYGLMWEEELRQQLQAQFLDQPVLVAEDVYKSED